MAYIDTRNDELRKLHSIYSHDISDFICKTVDNKLFNRIRDISKNKGVEISGFNVFPFKYSRLDHSFGVAIILERFKQSKGHVLEALIHELSKPSFSYSYEYLLSYFKIKDYVQPQLDKNIVNDSISADEIKAYSEYNGDYFALKFENIEKGQNLLENEAIIMNYLKGPNIPYIKLFGSTSEYNILVYVDLSSNSLLMLHFLFY